MRSARIDVEARLPGVLTVVEADLAGADADRGRVRAARRPVRDAPHGGPLQGAVLGAAARVLVEAPARRPRARGRARRRATNGLGGRRLGATGSAPPVGRARRARRRRLRRRQATRSAGTPRAPRTSRRASRCAPWRALEVGAAAYRAARRDRDGDRRPAPRGGGASTRISTLARSTRRVEGFAGTIAQGRFTAATALAVDLRGSAAQAGCGFTPDRGRRGARAARPDGRRRRRRHRRGGALLGGWTQGEAPGRAGAPPGRRRCARTRSRSRSRRGSRGRRGGRWHGHGTVRGERHHEPAPGGEARPRRRRGGAAREAARAAARRRVESRVVAVYFDSPGAPLARRAAATPRRLREGPREGVRPGPQRRAGARGARGEARAGRASRRRSGIWLAPRGGAPTRSRARSSPVFGALAPLVATSLPAPRLPGLPALARHRRRRARVPPCGLAALRARRRRRGTAGSRRRVRRRARASWSS